ncbi:MAG: 3-hydroxyacyl-[acyl-carrier-protein] dehydratase FabA, partial [Methylococcales bacterium]|nr:3-hydroxyacyl-[acyl-carrier-protein] dehydratase FabA [Methylococcales bacterium]
MDKQHSFTREELLQSGRGELYGPHNAQLPLPNMLMMDRITHISDEDGKYDKGSIIAELDITPDLWFFDC